MHSTSSWPFRTAPHICDVRPARITGLHLMAANDSTPRVIVGGGMQGKGDPAMRRHGAADAVPGFDSDEGPGLLASGWYWGLGAVSVALWTLVVAVAFGWLR